ncbi:MAG: DUF1566 domain-containing protein [Elusimicrobia bacterium]|nr:DUF1566 domain-containing protein [Elusimicrobiota bacterium]
MKNKILIVALMLAPASLFAGTAVNQLTASVPAAVANASLVAPVAPPARYADNNDGTVTDTVTKLMWGKDGNSTGYTDGHSIGSWYKAEKFCGQLRFASHDNWRLPSLVELRTFLVKSSGNPFFTNTNNQRHWTSTNGPGADTAVLLHFRDGTDGYDNKSTNGNYYVRCVRAGQ